MVESLLLTGDGAIVHAADLPPELLGGAASGDAPGPEGAVVPGETLRLDDVEREAILNAVRAVGGNLARAARRLGISRSTLYRKMAGYGLEP